MLQMRTARRKCFPGWWSGFVACRAGGGHLGATGVPSGWAGRREASASERAPPRPARCGTATSSPNSAARAPRKSPFGKSGALRFGEDGVRPKQPDSGAGRAAKSPSPTGALGGRSARVAVPARAAEVRPKQPSSGARRAAKKSSPTKALGGRSAGVAVGNCRRFSRHQVTDMVSN